MQKNRKKLNTILLTIIIMLILYCVLFIQELKWKLLLLPQGGLVLIGLVCELLEDAGKLKQASMLKKIRKILCGAFAVELIVIVLGGILGIWNL